MVENTRSADSMNEVKDRQTIMKMTRGAIAGIVVFFGGGCDAQNNQANDEPVQTAALEDDGQLDLAAMIESRRVSEGHVTNEDVARSREEAAEAEARAAEARRLREATAALAAEARRMANNPDDDGDGSN